MSVFEFGGNWICMWLFGMSSQLNWIPRLFNSGNPMIIMGFCSSFSMMNLVFLSVPKICNWFQWLSCFIFSVWLSYCVFSFGCWSLLGREGWMKFWDPPVSSKSSKSGAVFCVSEPCIRSSVLCRIEYMMVFESFAFFLLHSSFCFLGFLRNGGLNDFVFWILCSETCWFCSWMGNRLHGGFFSLCLWSAFWCFFGG